MRKTLTLLVFAVLFAVSASAEIQYQGSMNQEEVVMNTSIQLECDDPCPVSRWSLSWNLPENAEIIEIRDSLGEIDNYDRTGRTVSFTTNRDERYEETVRIRFRVEEPAEEIYDGLYYRKMSVPSFRGETTTGRIQVENLVSGKVGFGFQSSFVDEEFRFSGEGPTNIRVNFGEGEQTRYYEFFGDDRDNSSEAYELSIGTTGLVQNFERFPVAVMDNRTYNEKVNRWSSGEYVSGAISLRDDLGNDYLPVLAHETVHGLNDKFLSWDQTDSTYLDEGVAEHAEYLMKKKLYRNGRVETGTREVFGEEKEYRVEEQDGTYIYTLRPQGDRERLWRYYQDDREFMESWNPRQSEEAREFGYAYSELLIKYYVVNNGTVRDLYSNIAMTERVEDPEQKWEALSEHMVMEPCNFDSRERFDSCLDSINDYSYPVYTATPDRSRSQLEFKEIKVPNRTENSQKLEQQVENTTVTFQQFLKGFFEYLASLIGGGE
ncbi:MAG: hypothetical protein ACI8Z7_000907 [Candidatus Nanohaloarchaea archaeon]|jgi:hypothetical protein